MAIKAFLNTGSTKPRGFTNLSRAPTASDVKNQSIGDFWFDNDGLAWYILSDLDAGSATWQAFAPNISDDAIDQIVTDSGTATGSGNSVNILGTAAQGISSSATGATVTLTIADATTSSKGVGETALDSEANTGTATDKFLTPGNIGQWPGTTNITTLGTVTTGVWNGTTIAVANGGTGNTSFTTGSIPFSSGTILTEDNANLFWDDTNNRLGIGTTAPLDQLHVEGSIDVVHTSVATDDHALEIDCDAAGFGDVKAIDIAYTTGALSSGEDESIMLINIDETQATGGEIYGIEVLSTTEGADVIVGYKSGIGIDALHQHTGTFGDADGLLNIAVDVTAALASGGAGNISIFVADNDTFTIRDAAVWDEMEFILDTGASGGGVAPTFEYSTGGASYSAFVPIDGTNGFKNTGSIDFNSDDLAGWATATSGDYEVVITRTRNNLNTTPILDTFQLSAVTEHKWDKDGAISAASLTLTGALESLSALVDSAATTDSTQKFAIDGTVKFVTGVDYSDSEQYKISASTAFGTDDAIIIDSSGNVTIPSLTISGDIIASCAFAGADGSINANYNITSVTRTSAGRYNVLFDVDASSSAYTVTLGANASGDFGVPNYNTKATTGFSIQCAATSGSATYDSLEISFMVTI